MLRQLALHSVLLILVLAIAALAPLMAEDNLVETPIFRLEFPPGWKREGESTPLKVRGPNSEVLLMSIAMPAPGDRNGSRLVGTKQMAQFWKETIRRALVGATSQQGMKQTEPFAERVMQGLPLFTAKSQDDERGSFLSCYGLVGHGGAVFIITVEGWLKNKATAETAVEGMLKNIVWKRQS